jgi:hypothetical protein
MYEAPFRFYASSLGRWHSPDPLAGDITNPQSLNRYPYVLNNPATLTDPLGLQNCPTGTTESAPGQCKGDTGSTYQMWGDLGLVGGAINGPTNCVVDGMDSSCNELYQNLHSSASLLFEVIVGQGFANSVWTEVKWSDAQGGGSTLYYTYGNGGGYIGNYGIQWNLSTPTFLLGMSTPDWGGVFDITDLLGTYNWAAMANMPSMRALPQPRGPQPSSAGERGVIYAGCVMNPEAFGSSSNESGTGAIQGVWYAPSGRTTGPQTVPISPGPPAGLNFLAGSAANALGCAKVAKQQ